MPNNDQLFNIFVSKRINFDNSPACIYFSIDKVKNNTNREKFGSRSLLLQDGLNIDFKAKKYGGGFAYRKDRF